MEEAAALTIVSGTLFTLPAMLYHARASSLIAVPIAVHKLRLNVAPIPTRLGKLVAHLPTCAGSAGLSQLRARPCWASPKNMKLLARPRQFGGLIAVLIIRSGLSRSGTRPMRSFARADHESLVSQKGKFLQPSLRQPSLHVGTPPQSPPGAAGVGSSGGLGMALRQPPPAAMDTMLLPWTFHFDAGEPSHHHMLT